MAHFRLLINFYYCRARRDPAHENFQRPLLIFPRGIGPGLCPPRQGIAKGMRLPENWPFRNSI